MEITVGESGGRGMLAGVWMMHGPPPLLLQSTGAAYFPVTLTPFLFPRLIPVPSTSSLLLLWPSWKKHTMGQARVEKFKESRSDLINKVIKVWFS